MKLNELKFQTRGDLLEAAELIGIRPDDDVPIESQHLAVLTGYVKSFAPKLKWSNIFQKHAEELKRCQEIPFLTILYTTSDLRICVPGLPILDENGDMVKSDSAILESRTLHIDSILKNLYGKPIQAANPQKSGTIHDDTDPDSD